MSHDTTSTRRSFLKVGALIAAPIAAPAAAVAADGGIAARLARREDEAAIRDLHQSWLRRMNVGTADEAASLIADADKVVRGIAADHLGEPDTIEVSGDGRRAEARFHCAVDVETELAQDCTLAQMAHLQGGGFVRQTERHLLKAEYVKTAEGWAIAKVELAQA